MESEEGSEDEAVHDEEVGGQGCKGTGSGSESSAGAYDRANMWTTGDTNAYESDISSDTDGNEPGPKHKRQPIISGLRRSQRLTARSLNENCLK